MVKDGMFSFCLRDTEDNGKRGQRDERTTGGEDSRRSGLGGGQREERTATRVDTKKGSIDS